MKVEFSGLRFFGRPDLVGVPGIRSALKGARLPCRFVAFAVKVIAEECRLDLLAEFTRGLMTPEGDDADRISLGTLPLAVIPRSGDDEIVVIGIVLFGVAKNLPRSPGILLIPESSNV